MKVLTSSQLAAAVGGTTILALSSTNATAFQVGVSNIRFLFSPKRDELRRETTELKERISSELKYQSETATSMDINTELRNVPSTPQQQSQSPAGPKLLSGNILKEGAYMLTEYIPVASEKCELYEVFGIDTLQFESPLICKLSPRSDQISLEYQNYLAVAERLDPHDKHLFVEIYDKIEPSSSTKDMAGIIMERGSDNLRFDIQKNGRYQGAKLRNAMQTCIQAVNALHSKQMIWTEIKAENFVIFEGTSPDGDDNAPTIKGIDLESVVGHNQLMRMYTAEACPPEFPVSKMYTCLPKINMECSFDVWGLGLVLFELATGKPFYAQGLTDLEYIKGLLGNPSALVKHRDISLASVEPKVRDLILRCLQIDPTQRISCQDLLEDAYFDEEIGSVVAAPPTTYFDGAIVQSTSTETQRQQKDDSYYFATTNSSDVSAAITGEQQQDDDAGGNKGKMASALTKLALPLALESTLATALQVCEKHDPYVLNNFMYHIHTSEFLPREEQEVSFEDYTNNIHNKINVPEEQEVSFEEYKNNIHNKINIPKNAMVSLLDVINLCNAHDQETAIKLLSILEIEITVPDKNKRKSANVHHWAP